MSLHWRSASERTRLARQPSLATSNVQTENPPSLRVLFSAQAALEMAGGKVTCRMVEFPDERIFQVPLEGGFLRSSTAEGVIRTYADCGAARNVYIAARTTLEASAKGPSMQVQ
eukprot:scpid59852/ scgid34208/ 